MIVFTTVPNSSQAEALAEAIVNARLAACVQILPPMTSIYIWEGKVQKEAEVLLLIKTLPEKFNELERFIIDHHSYDVPEIVAVEPAKISASYLKWMQRVIS
ncbi:MAG: divalent-cation tolerance protein CutA [Chloracidobacterium sp.]|nr:divalent-cation tolerance protein CutA [Acidobacteriota bacterium]MBK9768928.1 divalent-cation tolerance protein CutA [Chloracidobacterium sp.]HQZ95716.1 divalent-cation tolerance protein CutA [Pyrinomonadaceae bacterium]